MTVTQVCDGELLIYISDPKLSRSLEAFDSTADGIVDSSDFPHSRDSGHGVDGSSDWRNDILDVFVENGAANTANRKTLERLFHLYSDRRYLSKDILPPILDHAMVQGQNGWSIVAPYNCVDSTLFNERQMLLIGQTFVPVWGEISDLQATVLHEKLDALARQIPAELFQYIVYGERGPGLKILTTNEFDLTSACECIGYDYAADNGAVFNPDTWTIYMPMDANYGSLSEERSCSHRASVIFTHELMHVLHNRLSLHESEPRLDGIEPSSAWFRKGNPKTGLVLHYLARLSDIFDSMNEYGGFVQLNAIDYNGGDLKKNERVFLSAARKAVSESFITIYASSSWQEYFAESAAAYFNSNACDNYVGDVEGRTNERLKLVDPVFYKVFSDFLSKGEADASAFSVEAFLKAYKDLNMTPPALFNRYLK